MKIPSIDYLLQNAKHSFLRFPLTIISALVGVVLGIYMVEYREGIVNMFPLVNVMLCAGLGIPLFFCSSVVAQKRNFSAAITWALQGLSIFILVGLYFSLPDADVTQNTYVPYIRYGIYNITIHLLVSFVPFIGNRQLNGFWNYNKVLFIRFWTSILYSGFLYVGLTMALVSLKLLFDIEIHEELFFDLYIVIIGFFNTWFFVAGIPKDFDALDTLEQYPKGLKIFAQYVLLPLLILYLLILYGYGTKIVILWDWPRGIVSYLIACVSVLGILTILLIYPYGNMTGNAWIKKMSKTYYFVLIPLIIILFIAIGMRMNDYGITINRYVIMLLGIWLSMVAIYFSIGKTNIKFIPTSLATILMLMSFGPWSMFSVSEKSQAERLKAILEHATILKEKKITQEVIWIQDSLPRFYSISEKTNEPLNLNDSLHNEVKSILDYLDDHHGFSSIKNWYTQNLDSMIKNSNQNKERWNQENEAEIYMRTLGLAYEYRDTHTSNLYFHYYADENSVLHITDYDYLVTFDHYEYKDDYDVCEFSIDSIKYTLKYSFNKKEYLSLETMNKSIDIKYKTMITSLLSQYDKKETSNIPLSAMRIVGGNNEFDFKIEFKRIGFDGPSNKLKNTSLSGNIFIKLKNNKPL